MRELWEKQLFSKILGQIQKRGLDIERFFDLIDQNDDKQISTNEFRMGLQSIKVILNQKDFNNLFYIFDKNKDGSINIDEMREVLQFYEAQLKGKYDLSEQNEIENIEISKE